MTWQTRSLWSRKMVMLLSLAVPLGLVGCGKPPAFEVSGAITLDGKPVPAGSVKFVPLDGSIPTNGTIENGNYVCRMPEAEYRDCQYVIQISGFDGDKNPTNQDMGYRLWEGSYDIKQKLDSDIREGLDFELTREQVGEQPKKPADPWDVT